MDGLQHFVVQRGFTEGQVLLTPGWAAAGAYRTVYVDALSGDSVVRLATVNLSSLGFCHR